jgi:SAM-dependent methyltransferase
MSDETPHIVPTWSATGSLRPEYFDSLYAQNADPWAFASSPYEAAKYAATLAALPQVRYSSALELGCSIGVLTEQLAPRCARLLACDIAEAALSLARSRCADLPQITFERRDLSTEFPAGRFDLILVSEVGYYLSQPDLDKLRSRIASALAPGGDVVLVHYTGATNYPLSADSVHETFLASEGSEWISVAAQRTESYRLDVFTRLEGQHLI